MKNIFDKIDVITDVTVVTVKNIPAKNNTSALSRIFNILTDNNIVVDMISQTALALSKSSVSFSISNEDSAKIMQLLSKKDNDFSAFSLDFFGNKTKLSFFSEDMDKDFGVASNLFNFLHSCNISIEMITTSTNDISVIIDSSIFDELSERIMNKFNYKIEV